MKKGIKTDRKNKNQLTVGKDRTDRKTSKNELKD